jgi:hypothetical protein
MVGGVCTSWLMLEWRLRIALPERALRIRQRGEGRNAGFGVRMGGVTLGYHPPNWENQLGKTFPMSAGEGAEEGFGRT